MGKAFFFDVNEAVANHLIRNEHQLSYWQSVYNNNYYEYRLSDAFDAAFYFRKTHRPEYELKKDIEFYKNLVM